MKDIRSLSHFKAHLRGLPQEIYPYRVWVKPPVQQVVFIIKYRNKLLYGQMRKDIRKIILILCKYKYAHIISQEQYV